jgi:Rne/Rng family ribonuclease
MSKELFVSSTPHEIKVGVVEDDLLAEIYLERENEYTLAGSIYKGRVTRVLPGMQSAFVDIGLERDAFLYVSDFMELPEHEEVDDIPTNGAAHQGGQQEANDSDFEERELHRAAQIQPAQAHPGSDAPELSSVPAGPNGNRDQEDKDNRGGFRGRRRRRGRRGERMPESKFARPAADRPVAPASEEPIPERNQQRRPERTFESSSRTSERTDRPQRSEYGPPPGYQPIILPGESISKYRGLAVQATAPASSALDRTAEDPRHSAETFPEDEPLFSTSASHSISEAVTEIPIEQPPSNPSEATLDIASSEWAREQKRLHEINVASVFGESSHSEPEDRSNYISHETKPAGAFEEVVIDEEESESSDYVQELEDDAPFEEMEEETSEAGTYHAEATHQIAAEAESQSDTHHYSSHQVTDDQDTQAGDANGNHEEVHVDGDADHEIATQTLVHQNDDHEKEAEEKEEVEAEIEEAQAKAEAILDAEARGEGTAIDAQVRAPSTTAGYTQRSPRPAYDRNDRNRGGRRGGGGRNFRKREPQNVPLISDLLKEGQEILVQIAKEPIGKKGARITSHIALPGRFLVYMPTVNHTGVSRKISSEEERQRLKRIIISERENGQGGFIVRTAAQNAPEEDLRADIRFLKGLWAEIKSRAEAGKSPNLIYHDLNVVERVLRDQVSSDFSAIWVDTENEYERVLRFANRFQPALVRKVKLYTKEVPLYEQFGLTEEINKALKSKVWLKSGGYIVINQTEALVAIDVNTGKYVGKTQRLEDTIVKTNVDAIKEIVRQIRLRDLGGIIIIDFIDMDERRNRQKVMQALEEALRADRAPSKVLQFNDFGLVAITRKRVKQSLERTIGSPCPYCDSTGFVKSIQTVCNDIYIEMRKMAKHLDHADAMLRVNPEVAKALKANNGKALTEMEELVKKTVIVKSDPALHQEQFDIN